MKFGAIDIGTNAARLLIGEVMRTGDQSLVKKISYVRIPLRLGLDVFEDGIISPKRAKAFKKAVMAFKLIAEVFNVVELRACATSAMREAKNGLEIQQMILKETGVVIEIIDGDEEANVIFSSFLLFQFDLSNPFIVVDVGGGSTEISIFYKGEKAHSRSFQIGTIRMIKKKVDVDIWDTIRTWLDENIRENVHYQLYGTGGNINNIHKLLGKRGNEPINTQELKVLYADLKILTLSQRIAQYQLKPDRADVIVPASQIFLKIIKHLKSTELFVPKVGLSDGMIHEMHKKHAEKRKKLTK